MPKKKPTKKPAKKPAAKKPAKRPVARKALDRTARVESLTAVFTALGAREPRGWALSQVDSGTDELARFVLLRALWLKVLEPGRLLARAQEDEQAGPAVDRMLKKVDLADLDAVVRLAQATALRDLLSVIDDPGDTEGGIGWGVFRKDKTGAPVWRLEGLVDDLDATRP